MPRPVGKAGRPADHGVGSPAGGSRGGPLTHQEPRVSSSEEHAAFDCSHPIPAGSKHYFEYLQSKGVTHFKVPLSWAKLLPTGLPSNPGPGVVSCYQTLLKQLLEVGLQPLVILHGSGVPDSLKSRYGGWESQWLLEMFQQYAEFALTEFGPLAHSWVTFSDLDGVLHEAQGADHHSLLQNILQLNKKIHQFYHQNFPGHGRRLSVGLTGRDEATLSQLKGSTTVDFLSVVIDYSCASSANFALELKELQISSGNLPIMIYKLAVRDCSHNDLESLGDLFKGYV
ncbi:lactase-phlorizin hydrolase-like [Fundulus heteroclitus]|uniref:lactase-phlorizin hydrolase-like n=1 Tax=Fundulus heteroclitus TaxID=8078 RepID=UPI00165C6B75|nr:lactase-phlorizin hydrolase-like [Fundulus heteroclitus]